MDKNTKLLLGIGLVGVGAYLLMQSKKPKATTSFAGASFNDVVGNRRGFVNELPVENSTFTGFVGAGELPVQDSGWVRADGGVQEFYDVQSPNWAKYAGNTQFFDVESKGWVRG
jgi:hypothetical protein